MAEHATKQVPSRISQVGLRTRYCNWKRADPIVGARGDVGVLGDPDQRIRLGMETVAEVAADFGFSPTRVKRLLRQLRLG